MSVTSLASWTLGPAYHHAASTEQLECAGCSAKVTEDQYCEGCGRELCDSCAVPINKQSHCFGCAMDARKGGQ